MKTKEQILNELTLTYLKKNKDYGNSADHTAKIFGDSAYLIRIHDKLSRIERLISSTAEVSESIEDTILDLIVYYAMWQTIGTEPRIVGIANCINEFLNTPMICTEIIAVHMPPDFDIQNYTLTYIEDYIAKL